MPLDAGEIASGGEVRDVDGRLIVVTAGGAPIGGGGGTASTVALDAPTLAALETVDVANLLNPHPVSVATALDISDRTARLLGHVTVDNASLPVTGTFWQATQPVSGTVTANVGTGTQPVSGTVTANAGTGPWPITDNGGSLTVDAPVGTPLRVDPTGTTVQPVSLATVPTVTEKQDQPASTTATWTSATVANTALTNAAVNGYGTATVSIQVPSTVTAGVITLEVSDDGSVWYPSGAVRIDNALQENAISLASGGVTLNRMYAVSVDAMTHIRARLSTVITGTGNVIVRIGLVAGGIEPFVSAVEKKDIGRNHFVLHMPAQVAATNVDVLMSLTGWKANAAVAATTTPAVVTAGRTLRLTAVQLTYIATATAGTARVTLRANTAGVVAITSPVVTTWVIGAAAAVAGVAESVAIPFPDGFEFAAGTGLGISLQGFGPTGVAAGNGWFQMSLHGFEY